MAGLDSRDVRAELEGKEGHDAAKASHHAPAVFVTYQNEDDETNSGPNPPLEPLTLTLTQPSKHTKQTMHSPSTLPNMSGSSTPSQATNLKFGPEEYAIMLNYLEDPKNKVKIWVVPGKVDVGVAPPRKVEAWKELAALINKKSQGKHNIVHKSVADRWRTYLNKYKVALDKSVGIGFSVTEADKKKNIHTIAAKLDTMCPHYARMHALVGTKPNVSAAASFESSCATLPPNLSQPHMLEPDAFFNEEFQTQPLLRTSQPAPLSEFPSEPLLGDLDSPLKQRERSVVAGEPNAKRAKSDKRKEPLSLSKGKMPTQTRRILAQTIQESASAKAEIMDKVEEQKLEFELVRWRIDREERESQRKAEREEAEIRRKFEKEEAEIRRREEKEEAESRRKEERQERHQERRFALASSMMKDGKSPSEIKEILDMLM